MSQYKYSSSTSYVPGQQAQQQDAGFQAYTAQVFSYLALGVLFAACCVALAAQHMELTLSFLTAGQGIPALIAFMLVGAAAPFVIAMGSVPVAIVTLFLVSGFYGVVMSPAVMMTGATTVIMALLSTTCVFAGSAIVGVLYGDRFNIKGMGRLLTVGLISAIIVGLLNLMIGSSLVETLVSLAVIVLMSGFVAYEMVVLQERYVAHRGSDTLHKASIMTALELFSSFATMFIHILSLLGRFNKS